MASPFPGMNPYLEQEEVWHDFHERMIPHLANVIAAQVDPHYIVKIDEHVFIQELEEDARRLLGRADVGVSTARQNREHVGAVAVLEAPMEVVLPPVDLEGLSYVKILDRKDRHLVAVLELVSPSNKNPGRNRDQYIAKRLQLLASEAHFVEIDLLRGGPRLPLNNAPKCDHYALVSRAEERPHAGFWPISLRDRLPVVPIPLRTSDKMPRLDVQAALNQVYEEARYQNYIYEEEPSPLLSPEDAAWAQQFVPRKG